jgi:hypothetical protein
VTALEMQVPGRGKVTEYVVENPVRELGVTGPLPKTPQNSPIREWTI